MYLLKLQLISTLAHRNRWRCTVCGAPPPPPSPATTIDDDSATPAARKTGERRGGRLLCGGTGYSMAAEIEKQHCAACAYIYIWVMNAVY